MTTIIPAQVEHSDFIATYMVKDYKRLNEFMGDNIYKTDHDFFVKILNERINTPDGIFHSFVALENETPLGFVSTMLDKNQKGQVLLISTEESHPASKQIFIDLFNYAVQYLRDQGVSSIIFESSPLEEDYNNLLAQVGAKHFSSKFII